MISILLVWIMAGMESKDKNVKKSLTLLFWFEINISRLIVFLICLKRVDS